MNGEASTGRWPVPSSWQWVKAADIADIVGGGTPDTTRAEYWTEGAIPWVTPADLSGYTEKRIGRGSRNITEKGLAQSGAKVLPASAVLMSSRAPVGYVAVAANPLATNQGFKSFVLRGAALPEYLYWFLFGNRELLASLASGTTFPELSGRRAGEIPIAVPPLAEQRRIVAALDERLSDLDAALGALVTARAKIAHYRRALLDAVITDLKSVGEPHQPRLGDVVASLDQGWSPRCEKRPAGDGEWAVIKTTAVQGLTFLPHENKALPSLLRPRPALGLEAGDILITRAGPRGRVGISCVVPENYAQLMACDKVYRVRLNTRVARPQFVALVLNSPFYLRILDELKTGISDSGVNLTQERFLDLRIPVPSLDSQRNIEQRVDESWHATDRAAADIDVQLARATRLRQSILKHAFEGKLVAQHPDDEPAAVLLERIRQERANAPATPARRPTRRKIPR